MQLTVLPWKEHELDAIKGYVTAGVSIQAACEAAGVRWNVAKHWLDKGNKGLAPWVLFASAMIEARARHRVALKLLIMKEAKRGDLRAAIYLDQMAEDREKLRAARAANRPLTADDRVVLLYPVPMPEGADASQLQLAPGHAYDANAVQYSPPTPADDEPSDEPGDDQ